MYQPAIIFKCQVQQPPPSPCLWLAERLWWPCLLPLIDCEGFLSYGPAPCCLLAVRAVHNVALEPPLVGGEGQDYMMDSPQSQSAAWGRGGSHLPMTAVLLSPSPSLRAEQPGHKDYWCSVLMSSVPSWCATWPNTFGQLVKCHMHTT